MKKNFSIIVLLVGVFIFSGCARKIDLPLKDMVTYLKDARTGLCFSVLQVREGGVVLGFTNVPCTPEVIVQINGGNENLK